MVIVTWKNLRLRVLDCFKGKFGEVRLMVCKEECPNPVMGRFSVRASDTALVDFIAGQ